VAQANNWKERVHRTRRFFAEIYYEWIYGMCNILSNAWPTFSCSNTRVVHNGRHVARILQGGGTEAAKVHFFSKKLTTFFSCRHQNLKGSIFLAYLRPAECNTENNVTLLNKAGHKSQQSQFFPVIIHPIDD